MDATYLEPIYVPAGRWGMPYNCDIPYETFDILMQHLSTAHKDVSLLRKDNENLQIDYIILTGDFESHDQWNYSQENTKDTIKVKWIIQ